jgi:hypothetical protein
MLRSRRARLVEVPAEAGTMVGVAQLVEHLVVVQEVAGSSPVTHPVSGQPPPHGPQDERVAFLLGAER